MAKQIAHGEEQGWSLGPTLDELATRNITGNECGAWETRHCESLGAAFLASCLGV